MLNSPGDHLTHCQKEKLLERMYWKDQFTEDNLQIIRDNLLSDNLNRNCLPCLDGQVMKLLCPNWSSTVKKGQHGSHKITKGGVFNLLIILRLSTVTVGGAFAHCLQL